MVDDLSGSSLDRWLNEGEQLGLVRCEEPFDLSLDVSFVLKFEDVENGCFLASRLVLSILALVFVVFFLGVFDS